MNNMLYDLTGKRLTALLDFDWACATHPAHDFFNGLWRMNGASPLLKQAILTGQFDRPGQGVPDDEESQWNLAEIWDGLLAKRDAIRPSTVLGMEKLDELQEFAEALAPFMLCNEFFAKRRPKDIMNKMRADSEGKIVAFLEKNGY
jgi:aminoglycoside phosphotransferase (APT) family kinase protein